MFDVWTLLVLSSQHLQHSIAGVEETPVQLTRNIEFQSRSGTKPEAVNTTFGAWVETLYSDSMLLYVSAVSLAHFMRLILVVNFVLHGFPSQQLSFCTSPSSRFEPWQSRGFMSNAISVLTQHMFQSSQSLLLSLGLRIPPLLIIGYWTFEDWMIVILLAKFDLITLFRKIQHCLHQALDLDSQ